MRILKRVLSPLRSKKLRRVIAIIALVGFALFSIVLVRLYHQLEDAFALREQFHPTLVFSDVTRVTANQTRSFVLSRLQALSYQPKIENEEVRFILRELSYPEHLIPEKHPTLELQGTLVTLRFAGTKSSDVLLAIETDTGSVPELYLEPELVTRFTHAGEGEAGQIRDFASFQEIPAPLWQAIIAVEDQHFLDHGGLDFRALARAIWVNLKTRSFAQGGSTITQQLVKNLLARRTKNIFQKFNEIFLAIFLEIKFEKEQILERYLNEVYLGQIGQLEIHGVTQGAKYFFGKTLSDLNLGEMALMAGLIRGPGYYSPYRAMERALQRQHWVLKRMVEREFVTDEEFKKAKNLPIRLAPPPRSGNKAPYFTDYVKAVLIEKTHDRMTEDEITNAGFRVYTTLDPFLNELGQKAVRDGVQRLNGDLRTGAAPRVHPVIEGALASVDQKTGFIRALVGGSDYSVTNYNRLLNMRRQVGSTFKPVVYLTALENGVGPGEPFEDSRFTLHYDNNRQSWSPRNFKEEYRGWVSLREGFVFSANVVAARVAARVGVDKIVAMGHRLGIQSDLPAVPSLALGSVELSPMEVLRLYALFGNRGVQDELTVLRAITYEDGRSFARFVLSPSRLLDESLADWITDLMKDVFRIGTAAPARDWGFTRPAAGKTGTTNDYRDAWFAGFTPELTTVVWVGLDGGSGELPKRFRLTGTGSALPIWVQYMKGALGQQPVTDFEPSAHLESIRIDKHSGRKASIDCSNAQILEEHYLPDRLPAETGCVPTYPDSTKDVNI